MIYFSQQITQMKQIGKSLRSCLSASPSACLAHADYIFIAHAENAENADFASRYALAASGMYTLGETPTSSPKGFRYWFNDEENAEINLRTSYLCVQRVHPASCFSNLFTK